MVAYFDPFSPDCGFPAATDPAKIAGQVLSAGSDKMTVVFSTCHSINALNAAVTTLTTSTSREKAETAIDAAITAGKLFPALRDHYIARHMKEPDAVQKERVRLRFHQ